MGENSKIEWTDHTFNSWIGCTKVHQGCANCYAEEMMDHRYHKAKWGDKGTRVVTSDSKWREPLKWNAHAANAGVRKRVFCASLADVFEDRDELKEPRVRLFDMIDQTPNLDWLVLTKRPENIATMWDRTHCPNLWLGTSISLQAHADKQLPYLVAAKRAGICAGLFISAEPLLGELRLQHSFDGKLTRNWLGEGGIGWVIAGGESGRHARPCHPDWIGLLRNQCVSAGIPFFFKQWGEWAPSFNWKEQFKDAPASTPVTHLAFDGHRGQSIAEMEGHPNHGLMVRIGKKAAGATYAGREWRETPF